ncbi:hypothetical protein [Actinomadura sp. 6N118]
MARQLNNLRRDHAIALREVEEVQIYANQIQVLALRRADWMPPTSS